MPAETSSTTDVTMPQLGVSVAEGTIVRWLVAVGDEVRADDPLCEIDTDKIVTDIPSPVAGTLAEILVDAGKLVTVGTVLARIATTDADRAGGVGEATSAAPPAEAPAPTTGPARSSVGARPNTAAWHSPVVSRLAAEHGVDLAAVVGTGRGGRVRKQDVLAAVQAPAEPPMHIESPYRPDPEPAPADSGGATLSRMRRAIGAHMKRSLETAATCTTWIEVDFSRVEAERARLGLTALPIVARAAIDALRVHPSLNATLEGETYRRYGDAVHLGIAVSLDEEGLVVPVIRDAQDLSAEGLGRSIRDVARRARAKQLEPDEVHGGTFTITNPGQFGSIMATPVINQPQVGILDVEAVVKRPVVVEGDAIAVRPICILGLSWDHRALDGVLAARFLAEVKRRLEAG